LARVEAARGAPAPDPEADAADAEARRDALLAKIEGAIAGGKRARQLQVEQMRARGIDPREGWIWDEEKAVWAWDPGPVFARARGDEA
jgi:hypothetical protein